MSLAVWTTLSKQFGLSENIFVCYGGHTKGLPVSKQKLSYWVVDAITLAYDSQNATCPIGMQAHSTRGMASSWEWARGVPIGDIYSAAGEALQNTFAKFYSLI